VTEWLTPYCRVLLENLTVPGLVKEFIAIYRAPNLITVLKRTCHFSLTSASKIQSIPSVSCYHSVFAQIFQFVSFFGLTHQNSLCISRAHWAFHIPCPSHLLFLNTLYNIWWSLQFMKLLITKTSPSSFCLCSSLNVRGSVFPYVNVFYNYISALQ